MSPHKHTPDFRTLEDAEIQRFAMERRRHWGLGNGPISNIHLLMEKHGIIIVHDEVGSGHMDGVSAWSSADGRGFHYRTIGFAATRLSQRV